ncbi:MAG: hypothetical protein QOF39_2671 [Frankiales bacterium]|nr:hypothetical protein [Frankiales bacterium]
MTRLGRPLLCAAVAVAGMIGFAVRADAAGPALVNVVCTAAVPYGGEVDCRAASVDANGDYGTPGTFTFDPGHVLPATWSATTCSVNGDACTVSAQLATPAGAGPRTFTFDVGFVGADGSTSTTPVSVDVSLQQTVTTLACDHTELATGGATHCLISAVDQHVDGSTSPARLPAGGPGLTATSSDPSDVVTYDNPSADRAGCVAAVAGNALECGFTLAVGSTHGLRTVTASYPGDAATDEAPSQAAAAISNGARVAPIVSLRCPASVPAEHPQTSCTVTVTGPRAGDPVPGGTVELDQAAGQPLPFDSGIHCTLVNGSCTAPYEVFEGTASAPAPPVRALYSGDSSYLPGSASQQVAVLATGTVSTLVCDNTAPRAFTPMHCQFSVSTVDAKPVPVGPLDAITFTTTSGSVSCDQPVSVGCGHVNTATATVSGFTLRLGKIGGPQSVTASYSGDAFALVASSTSTFAFSVIVPPVSSDVPPVVGLAKTATSTGISCGSPVAYRHAARCVVTVKATGSGSADSVPAGSVRLAPVAGQHTFTARSCLLNGKGQCTLALAVSTRPGSVASINVTYPGSAGFLPSAAVGRLAVRTVATSVTVRCAHPAVRAGSVVHCVAAVRTEFGAPAAAPGVRKSQVTVTAHGDVIGYAGGRSCHWTRSGNNLTCAFSVKAGRVRGSRTIHVYYTGDHASQDAASRGVTTLRVT